jgi:hypothetical protein
MVLHATAFTLFALSIAIFTGFYANYLIDETTKSQAPFLVAEIVM